MASIQAIKQNLLAISLSQQEASIEICAIANYLDEIRQVIIESGEALTRQNGLIEALQVAEETLEFALAYAPAEAASPAPTAPDLLPQRHPKRRIKAALDQIRRELKKCRP